MLFRIWACCYIILISQISHASNAPDNNRNEQGNQRIVEAAKLHNSEKWRNFVNQRELNELYFSLHRSTGPEEHHRVISAQNYPLYVVDMHNKMFCSIQDNKNCTVESGLFTYGDMRNSIFVPNVYTDPKELHLAANFVTNMIIGALNSNVALEMRDASPQDRELPENKAALGQLYLAENRLGVVRTSFNTMLQYRTPLNLLNDKPSSIGKNNFSIISIMEQEATERFADPKWHELIEDNSQEFALKELAKIAAYQNWMDYHKYKQNERIEALLATMVAQQESINQLLMAKDAKNN